MVIDSSALIAIIRGEPERVSFENKIKSTATRRLGGPSYVETSMVALSRYREEGSIILEELLTAMRISIVPLTTDQAKLAVDAFRRFGKGRHPAGLNFGDCLTYALARAMGEPLLFKGDGFSQTDITPA